jgi:hypothetical protein
VLDPTQKKPKGVGILGRGLKKKKEKTKGQDQIEKIGHGPHTSE